MKFSDRILAVQPSATLAAAAKAKALKAKGVKVIDFTVGEPMFPTPEKIKQACKAGLDANMTRYGAVPGELFLREAICKRLQEDYALDYLPEEVLVTCGAKHAINSVFQIFINPGDEVLLVAPYWVSYADQVHLAQGKPVVLPTEENHAFKLQPETLEKAITPKTRMLVLNSPSNPGGITYSGEELAVLGKICQKHNLLVLSDEIYDKLVYDNFRHIPFVKANPEMRSRTIHINGASKAYAMTGWRMGYACAPKEIIAKLQILQSQETTMIPPFIQKACATALLECGEDVEIMRKGFEARRNKMFELLTKIPGVRCFKPKGAFYLFPNVSALGNSSEIADMLLEKAHVATVSGEGFGTPGYLRLSYATSLEEIEEGLARMTDVLR